MVIVISRCTIVSMFLTFFTPVDFPKKITLIIFSLLVFLICFSKISSRTPRCGGFLRVAHNQKSRTARKLARSCAPLMSWPRVRGHVSLCAALLKVVPRSRLLAVLTVPRTCRVVRAFCLIEMWDCFGFWVDKGLGCARLGVVLVLG